MEQDSRVGSVKRPAGRWISRTGFLLLPAFLAAFYSGCSLVNAYADLTSIPGKNPLDGGTLRWSQQAKYTPMDGPSACTVWPIEDTLSVTASTDEICVTGRVNKLWTLTTKPAADLLTVSSDGTGDGGTVGGTFTQVIKGEYSKIGSCYDKASSTTKDVWVTTYSQACVKNKTPSGRPYLSQGSTYLKVGDARWKFPAPAPTTGPAQEDHIGEAQHPITPDEGAK